MLSKSLPSDEIAILAESLSHIDRQIDAWLAVLGDATTPDGQRPVINEHIVWLLDIAETKRSRLAWLRQQEDGHAD